MRGGAQSHLIQATDGELYVLKATNNPQGRRTLINEWLCCSLLRHLGIFVPATKLIEVTPAFVASQTNFYISLGSRREDISPGIHFGSQLAVNPNQIAIFDFLPDTLLAKVENRQDFLGALVFDKWVANADSRQAVFFRARRKKRMGQDRIQPGRACFWAQMIDYGHAFDGPQWCYQDSALQGLYVRTSVYGDVTSIDSFEPWLSAVKHFPAEMIDAAKNEIPEEWVQHDKDELERLLDRLLQRRARVPDLIYDMRRNRPVAFAKWPRLSRDSNFLVCPP